MYSIGKAPDLAASKLQNSIRRFLFRCKIRKYLAYYNKILTERSEKIFSVIKKHIRNLKMKKWRLKNKIKENCELSNFISKKTLPRIKTHI